MLYELTDGDDVLYRNMREMKEEKPTGSTPHTQQNVTRFSLDQRLYEQNWSNYTILYDRKTVTHKILKTENLYLFCIKKKTG